MADQIKDGTGKGFLVKVDSENRLLIHSDQNTEEHNISHQFALAYTANTAQTADFLTIGDGETAPMLYVRNDDSDRLINLQLVVFTQNTALLQWRVVRNPVLGTIGANNVHVPVNANFGSDRLAVGTFFNWDESGTEGMTGLTGGDTVVTIYTPAGALAFQLDASIILGPGNSMMLVAKNATGGAVEAAASIRFYYEDIG